MRCTQRTGIEPVPPEAPTTTIASVQTPHVPAVYLLHHFGQTWHLVRHGNQGHMIGHQAVSQNRELAGGRLFAQQA